MSVLPRHALWTMGFTGLLVGGTAAISWHLFVSTHYEEASFGPSARAFETFEPFYEPAPAWLPTIVAFPAISVLLFCTATVGAQRWRPTKPVAGTMLTILSILSGVAVGTITVMWAMISPPTYSELTRTRPLRIALPNELHLWLVLPGLCATTSLLAFVVWKLVRPARDSSLA